MLRSPVRAIHVRHKTAPLPMGCRWCGVPQREHAQRWVLGHGWHGWAEPTRAQITARLRVRLTARRRPGQSQINATGRQRAESAIKNSSKE